MSETAVKTCFVIGPIGDPRSLTRNNADWLLKGIIQPILKEKLKFKVQRADEIARPGMIDSQVINAVIDADLVIADLSENNPNAFYELAIRHMEARPVIHMTREPEIPFDVKPYRTIPFSTASYEDVEKAKSELEKQVIEALAPDYEADNPITKARGKKKWRETATSKELVIMDTMDNLGRQMNVIVNTVHSLVNRVTQVERASLSGTSPLSAFARPFGSYMTTDSGVPPGETPLPLRSGIVPSGETGLPWSQETSSEPPPKESG
jgi:hypothetical protein